MPTTHTIWIKFPLAFGILFSLAAAIPLRAQQLLPLTTVHAAGEQSVNLKPQILRVTITMHAEGTDAKSAVRSLAEHKARVKQDLVTLKADEDSIKFGATQLGGVTSVMGAPPPVPNYSPVAPSTFRSPPTTANNTKLFRAVATVTADWPLPTTDLDALALLPDAIRAQVEAHDLRGEKNKAELSPEEQERREEMQLSAPVLYNNYEAAPLVTVDFVAKIEPAARQGAIKSAYEKAVAEAKLLASVTDRELGKLVRLHCNEGRVLSSIPAYPTPFVVAPNIQAAEPTDDEVTASSPDDLKLRVHVETEFQLEE